MDGGSASTSWRLTEERGRHDLHHRASIEEYEQPHEYETAQHLSAFPPVEAAAYVVLAVQEGDGRTERRRLLGADGTAYAE